MKPIWTVDSLILNSRISLKKKKKIRERDFLCTLIEPIGSIELKIFQIGLYVKVAQLVSRFIYLSIDFEKGLCIHI